MLKELIKIKEWLIDVLMPKFCVGCGREGTYICKDCEIFLSEAECNMKEAEPLSMMSVWEYEGLMEKLIYKIKYDGCSDIIGELVKKAFEKIDLRLPQYAVITFVPMHKKKEKYRGFNQAELIAQKVGEATGRPVAKFLEKIKDNRSQVGLNPQERTENVKGVFNPLSLLKSDFNKTTVLLVDDVYTTGATMAECMKVLKKAGVKNIYGFTLAKKLRL